MKLYTAISLILCFLVQNSFTRTTGLTEEYAKLIKDYRTTRNVTPEQQELLLQLAHLRTQNKLKDGLICELCYIVAGALILEWRLNVPLTVIELEAVGVCTIFGIESGEVCRGVIDLNLPTFDYIIRTNPDLKPERMCDIIMQNDGCDKTTFEWTVDIPEGESAPRKQPSNPESGFNILHITDVHYDPYYTPGKNKNCDAPLCCQPDQPDDQNITPENACGYWSEYAKGDTSDALIDETIKKANEFDFDYVYFTGDAIAHRVWGTSVEENSKSLKSLFKKMKDTYTNIPIYMCSGNHEPSPVNEYSIGTGLNANLSSLWLYQLIADEFSEWLPEEAKQTLLLGGFYSVSPREGFRIISINSNVAYTENWWLIHDDVDPFGQLAWLAQTLKAAEDANEVVHILSHIPSGKSDLLKVWSREYSRIINRFAGTIGAQFNGHTHHDQFMVYFSATNASDAVSIAINGASVMPDKSNPSFKLLNIDSSSFDVLDTEEWTFNLTEANINGDVTPNWYKLYSFRDQYGVKSLIPSEFSELLPRMATNHSLLYDYHILRARNSDIAIADGCDDNCKLNYLCEISISEVGNNEPCDILQTIYKNN